MKTDLLIERMALLFGDVRDALYERDTAHGALKRLVALYDEESGTIDVSPSPGCLECTCGVTPNKYNTGLCALHEARKAIAKASKAQEPVNPNAGLAKSKGRWDS